MTIIDQPLSLSLLGNIKPFRIGSAEKVSFVLKKGADIIIQETYDPGTSGVVEIDVKDILSGYLSYDFRQTTDAYIQTNIVADFVATISGTDVTFRVIRCGVDALADTPANFLRGNFLTWQPQMKPVTYYQPEYLTYYAAENCTAKLVATMQDKSTQTLNLVTMTAGSAYTIPAQYGTIAAKLTGLPLYYDIYIANAAGDRLTYTQRYYPTAALSEQEQWILFENSLGGMDTFRAYGQEEFTGEHTHNIAEIDEVSEEYRVDTERKHKKNTGYLDEYDRKWLLDFFPAKKKYIYTGSSVRAIVVTESNVTYTDKELPSNFDFTYKYAESKPYLNLVRNEDLPSNLEITLPDATSFTLPPRLIDFPRITLSEGALFPVQSPYAETWTTTTAGALAEYFANYLKNIDSLPAIMTINSGGDDFLAWGEEKNITCKVTKGFEDITSTMKTWIITRDSGDSANDNAWNIAHQNFTGNITLAFKEGQNDLGADTQANISTMFTIFASDQAGTSSEGNLII